MTAMHRTVQRPAYGAWDPAYGRIEKYFFASAIEPSFWECRIYPDMFRRGRASRLTHAVVFDEAHRAGKLKLLPTFAKECRKYGLALIVASQEAKDFDPGLFAATGSYLVLRVTDQDAKVMAKNAAGSDQERALADRLKTMPKYEAMFFSESLRRPLLIRLSEKFG